MQSLNLLYLFVVLASCMVMGCSPGDLAAKTTESASSQNKTALDDVGPDAAADAVKKLYGLISEDPVNVIDIIPQGHMYRVTFEVLGPKRVEQSVFVTRDGQFLAESLTDIGLKTRNVERERGLLECLSEKGLRVFIHSREQASLAQVTELGRFHSLVTIDCSAAPENCAKHGATTFPTILDGTSMTQGPKPLAWFEALTLCK